MMQHDMDGYRSNTIEYFVIEERPNNEWAVTGYENFHKVKSALLRTHPQQSGSTVTLAKNIPYGVELTVGGAESVDAPQGTASEYLLIKKNDRVQGYRGEHWTETKYEVERYDSLERVINTIITAPKNQKTKYYIAEEVPFTVRVNIGGRID